MQGDQWQGVNGRVEPKFDWRPISGGRSPTSRSSTKRAASLPSARRSRRPHHLVEGISAGVEKAGSDYASAQLFLHGSTVAINTILERTGAATALVITEGFRDIYEIGRINRPDAYNLYFKKHVPLVERALRFEVKERVLADGEVERPLDDAEVTALAEKLGALGIEATAVLFLNCYRNAEHEARAKAIIEAKNPNMFVSASHELSQEYREFERCSTVVANAYIGPRVKSYIGEIEEHAKAAGFDRLVADRAVDRWTLRGRAGQEPMRAHAGVRAGCGRHRHPGALPHASGATARSRSTWAAPPPRPASSPTARRSPPARRCSAATIRRCRCRSP